VPVQRFSPSRLRQLRLAAGMTRTEIAYAASRAEQSVWLWEAGRTTPPTDVLERIAQALGCRIDDLFEVDGDG
jgi:transcriptional regulator with XRE-family HTH domain